MTLARTPLFSLYKDYGAKTIDFGGWDMPVQFAGILAEHEAVRTKAGIFDVSHMGEIEVSGPQAEAALQYIVTNDVSKLVVGQALYSPMCYPDGGTVDDVLVYRLSETVYWVVVNAANIEKDFAWIRRHATGAAVINRSADIALLALQGPLASTVLGKLTTDDVENIAYYTFRQGIPIAGISCLVSRTGYTGEDGFELYVDAADAVPLFVALMDAGAPLGVVPAGLGARDTLRLEARLPLYGHELADDISPLEAGLGMFVKWNKGDFIGKSALQAQKESGLRRKLAGFMMDDRNIARASCEVQVEGTSVGMVTSGTMGPTVRRGIGLALIDPAYATIGQSIDISIRGKLAPATIVKTPFYKRS